MRSLRFLRGTGAYYRTARRLGITTVAVYSEADRGALYVELADEAWPIGPAPAGESYLNIERLLEAARNSAADAMVFPGAIGKYSTAR